MREQKLTNCLKTPTKKPVDELLHLFIPTLRGGGLQNQYLPCSVFCIWPDFISFCQFSSKCSRTGEEPQSIPQGNIHYCPSKRNMQDKKDMRLKQTLELTENLEWETLNEKFNCAFVFAICLMCDDIIAVVVIFCTYRPHVLCVSFWNYCHWNHCRRHYHLHHHYSNL